MADVSLPERKKAIDSLLDTRGLVYYYSQQFMETNERSSV